MESQPQTPALGAAPSKSFVAKLAGAVASHAYMSLAIIIVLTILVLAIYVYYHGLLFLGPYASKSGGDRRSKKKKEGGFLAETDAGTVDDSPSGDAETERLIESITRQ